MPLVGTAGHVDHGKSTLVERLTGRDPDRWAEEKQRGLTIDLGFSWATLPSGVAVSFVDVPGHERYMKNALAGVDGFDAVMLVVAADEGWSPQTSEHVAALDAIGITRGVLVLTKVDAAEADLAELVALDALERLEATSLAGIEVVYVSAVSGHGIDRLVSTLDAVLADLPDRSAGPVRLWVDRVFSVAGSGTVVTGSLTSGAIRPGDRLEVLPGRRMVTVRGIHRHDEAAESVSASSRVALNLTGLRRDELHRGDLIATPATAWDADRMLISVHAREEWQRGAFHVHLGTGAWRADIRPIDDRHALVVPDRPVPTAVGDRMVIRDVGRRVVVGGGTVLDPAPANRRTVVGRTIARLDPPGPDRDLRAAALLDVRGVASPEDLARWTGGGSTEGTVSAALLDRAAEDLGPMVDDHHRTWPLRPGLPRAEAAAAIGIGADALEAVLEAAGVVGRGPVLARPDHDPQPTPADKEAWANTRASLLLERNAPGRLADLALDVEVVHHLLRTGDLVDVGGFAYLPEVLTTLVSGLGDLGDGWTVGDFRDHAGISRRHAVPLLEWLDTEGITRRTGDTRSLR